MKPDDDVEPRRGESGDRHADGAAQHRSPVRRWFDYARTPTSPDAARLKSPTIWSSGDSNWKRIECIRFADHVVDRTSAPCQVAEASAGIRIQQSAQAGDIETHCNTRELFLYLFGCQVEQCATCRTEWSGRIVRRPESEEGSTSVVRFVAMDHGPDRFAFTGGGGANW